MPLCRLTPDVLFAPLQAGKAVKMLSSVPVVGVLAGPIGTMFKACDGYVQTRRLEKVGLAAIYVVISALPHAMR